MNEVKSKFLLKFLIIRFSSFGDVTQCLSVPSKIKLFFPSSEIHWTTREDMTPLLEGHPAINRIWKIPKNSNFLSLLKLIKQLKKEKFTHVYDAHNNLRSHIISWFLNPFFNHPHFLRKSQKRFLRILLFYFRINKYRQPFSGQRDLLEPLKKWGVSECLPNPPQIFVTTSAEKKIKELLKPLNWSSFITLAPSAAFTLKRWPLEHWKKLISLHPEQNFVALGGAEDFFLQELTTIAPTRIVNWAGLLSLQESIAAVSLSRLLISNDTGLLHVGEQLGKPTIALMGPAPFGYPSRETTKILELQLSCRPCSKHGQGPCINKKFHQCLVDISPEHVSSTLKKIIL